MKFTLLSAVCLLAITAVQAQQKEGKVIYERTTQMQLRLADAGETAQDIPRTRVDRFELNFANGQMTLRTVEEPFADEPVNAGGGMMIRTVGAGADDIVFCDFTKSKKLEQRDFLDKKFLITDSIKRGNWKLEEETKTILGYQCRKATSQRIGKRAMITMDNGQMVRKEVEDTSAIVAWFTTDIPVAAGPDVQGQLPGLILELETNNGRSVYKAVEFSPKPNMSALKEPSKGKKVTAEQFSNERMKIMEEMQKNNGGNFRIRVG